VVLPISDVQVAYGVMGSSPGGAISASVVAESMVTIGDCNSPTPGCDGVSNGFDLCEQGSATVDGGEEVDAGGTIPDITVTVFNCPIVTVGLGTSNNDTVMGTPGVDCIFGFGGQDVLKRCSSPFL
jgi:hypothetical protein